MNTATRSTFAPGGARPVLYAPRVVVLASAPPMRWAAAASFAMPFALAALCAGNGMGFYDSPELASSGAGLGVTHPPGHPLFVVAAALASLVPLGAVAFRIALLSALCLGTLGLLAYGVARALVARVGGDALGPRASAVLSLAGSLTATLGPATLRQATRAEVYALAALLALSLLALAERGGAAAWRARAGALTLALGAANHHFIALTAAPMLGTVVLVRWREARASAATAERALLPWRTLVAWAALFGLGLLPYVLLPLRADASASLPRPHALIEIFETASARVFAKNTGASVPGSASARGLDVLDWLGETLTPFGLLFAAGGLYLAARTPGARRQAGRLSTLVLVVCAARAWLGFVRNNPDAAGYLVPAVAALGIASAAFAAGSARALAQAPPSPEGPSRSARILLVVLLVGGPTLLPAYLAYASVRATAVDRSYAPEVLALTALRDLPPRAFAFVYDPQTIFRLRYAQLVEGERPDVTVVPEPLLGYPGMIPWLLAREPALGPLMTHYILRPERGFSPRILSELATRRPVALEIDPRNVVASVGVLLPRGPFAQVMPEPTTLASVRGAAAAHFTRIDQLAALLERESSARALFTEALLWRCYNDALFFAARGARPEARRAAARALELAPRAREVQALRDALAAPGEAPLDVTPFLPAR